MNEYPRKKDVFTEWAHVNPDDPLLEIPEFMRADKREVKPRTEAPEPEPEQKPVLVWADTTLSANKRRQRRYAPQNVLVAIKKGADTMQKLKATLPDLDTGVIRSGLNVLLGRSKRRRERAVIELQGRRYVVKERRK